MNPTTSGPTLSQLGFGNLVKQSWDVVKKNYWSLLKIALVTLLIACVSPIVTLFLSNAYHSSDTAVVVAGLVYLVFIIVQLLMTMGCIHILVKVSRGEVISTNDLFAKNGHFWKYLLASILYTLIIFAGIILFIVPGMIWALKYSMVIYLIIDKDMGVMDAFKESSKMTKGSKGTILIYGWGFALLNLVGMLALGLGLLVTMPITWIANGLIYVHLSKRLGVASQ